VRNANRSATKVLRSLNQLTLDFTVEPLPKVAAPAMTESG
jgi:hypothetical protein